MVKNSDFKWLNTHIVNKRLISSLAEYLEYVRFVSSLYGDSSIWFRGHCRSAFRLMPGIYRNQYSSVDMTYPTDYFYDFIRRAQALGGTEGLSEWNWYYLMQHYGMPTRLLDWTEGSLIALHFALRDDQDLRTPCVWVLSPYELNLQSRGDSVVYFTDDIAQDEEDEKIIVYSGGSRDVPDLPIAIIPPYTNERLAVQRSAFTVHGRLKNGLMTAQSRSSDYFLVKLRIRTTAAKNVREDLELGGITETTFFPDLEGLSREMRRPHVL